MKRTDLTWMAILALLIAATVYEMPSVVGSLRDAFSTFSNRNTEGVLPEEVAAEDPEAAAILRYRLEGRYSETMEADLAALVKKFPENAYLLSEYTIVMARHPLADVLPLVDRLQNMDPNNAYYPYLRGYVLLRAEPPKIDFQSLKDRLRNMDPNSADYQRLKGYAQRRAEQLSPSDGDGVDDMDPNDTYYQVLIDFLLFAAIGDDQRVTEALQTFARGHDLPRLTLPYLEYKSRIDRLARKAHIGRFHLHRTWQFIGKLDSIIGTTTDLWSADRERCRDLIDSTARIADRLMENAWDMESRRDAADLVRRLEGTQLRNLDLTETEAWQARLRLSRAIAIGDSPISWEMYFPATDVSFLSFVPLIMLIFIPIGVQISATSTYWALPDSPSEKSGHAVWVGLCVLAAALVLQVSRRAFGGLSFFAGTDIIWFAIAIGWLWHAEGLGRVAGVKQSPQRKRWIIGFGLLVVNGLVLLLIGNARFFWNGSLTGWPDHLGIFGVWLLFCLLLWFAANRSQLAFGRFQRMFVVMVVVSWAGFLLICDMNRNQWLYEDRPHTDPLSIRGPLPAPTEETYNRIIRDAPPLQAGDADPHALPEYIEYLTPADFEALLARRRDEGHPMTKLQLRRLMDYAARDLRPIIEKAMDASDAASPSTP